MRSCTCEGKYVLDMHAFLSLNVIASGSDWFGCMVRKVDMLSVIYVYSIYLYMYMYVVMWNNVIQ